MPPCYLAGYAEALAFYLCALTISSLCIYPDGSVDVYSKQHLYVGEEQAFVPGTGGKLMRVSSYVIAPAICFETSHPSHVQRRQQRCNGLRGELLRVDVDRLRLSSEHVESPISRDARPMWVDVVSLPSSAICGRM